jgi:hypothetical protein
MSRVPRAFRVADSGGVIGAVLTALCCAGTPFIVGGLAAVSLSSLRSDAILWPLMLGSLGVALWGFWQGWRLHRDAGPMIAGAIGGASLAAGVIVVHGFPAMQMIWGGAAVLLAATIWNVRLRAACGRVARHRQAVFGHKRTP